MKNLPKDFFLTAGPGKWNYSSILIISLLFLYAFIALPGLSKAQSGDLSQIRNGNGKTNQQGVLDTCGTCWVNGNAGASNAHYVEGMSIAYRSLLTGLTIGTCYEYEVGYDTYHGAMAIDFLTHFQRLAPHQPFGHNEEVINPLVLVSGNTTYIMPVQNTHTLAIPVPQASGIASGAVDEDGDPFDISTQPVDAFNDLAPGERVMTIYNGLLQAIYYQSQAPIVIDGADAETRVRIRFVANDDSVLLAWGGHIASRLDWGYRFKQNNIVPLSAGGISGSPYHMRQKALYIVECGTGNNPVVVSGFGNQDRSLSAAAVVPPPVCPDVTSQTICAGTSTFTFSIDDPDSETTYSWSFGANSVGAVFKDGDNTGESVIIVHSSGGGFPTAGTFTLNVTATKNQIPLLCEGVATGTVIKVLVDALDADDAFVLNLNVSTSQSLGIESISPGTTADYNFQWELVSKPIGANSSFTNGSTASATFNVLSPYAIGVYKVRVVATQKTAPFCSAADTVTIDATGGATCGVSGPSPVCPGSQDNVYVYDPNGDGAADPLPANFSALWSFVGLHPSATFDGSLTGNSVKVDVAALGSSCNTSYTVRITLTSTSGAFTISCDTTVSVEDNDPPVITSCPPDANIECGASTDPEDVGIPAFTDNCGADSSYSDATISNCNRTVITRTWVVTDFCGNKDSCVQIITLTDNTVPQITCPPDLTVLSGTALDCGESTDPSNTLSPLVTDNCSALANILIFYKDAYDPNASCGTVTRTWYAVDESGNQASCTQVIEFNPPAVTIVQEKPIAAAPAPAGVKTTVQEAAKQMVAEKPVPGEGLQIAAFPNPFRKTVTFRFSSPQSGRALIEMYNMMGQKLGVAFEGYIKAGVFQDITYKSPWIGQSTMIYRLTVNGKSAIGKLFQE